MPYGPAESPSFVLEGSGLVMDTPEIIRTGKDGIVLAVGNKVTACDQAIDMLVKQGVFYGLVNLRKLKPLPEADLLELVRAAPHIVTVEEGVLEGGVGAAISAFMHQHRLSAGLTRVGLPCAFIEAGSNDELTAKYGLDAAGIARQIAVGRTLL
jgi:1-deoxy-D-xylulose-5-phosphate synthase